MILSKMINLLNKTDDFVKIINLHNKTGLGRSGHVQIKTFHQISNVSNPKMTF